MLFLYSWYTSTWRSSARQRGCRKLLRAVAYSVPHEESELMLGMYDVTSIVTIHFT